MSTSMLNNVGGTSRARLRDAPAEVVEGCCMLWGPDSQSTAGIFHKMHDLLGGPCRIGIRSR